METMILEAQTRDQMGRAARREAGTRIPVVLYGKEIDSQSLWIDSTSFGHVFVKGGESTIFDLVIDGAKKAVPVLVRDIARDPLSYNIIHVDLYQVKLGVAITAEVSVHVTGEAPAVKNGGTLIHSVDTLGVRCLPKHMPSQIVIDVSKLETFDDQITVKDIDFDDNVECTTDKSVVVVGIAPPRIIEEEAVVTTTEEEKTDEKDESEKKD